MESEKKKDNERLSQQVSKMENLLNQVLMRQQPENQPQKEFTQCYVGDKQVS